MNCFNNTMDEYLDTDEGKLQEKCGVVGIYLNKKVPTAESLDDGTKTAKSEAKAKAAKLGTIGDSFAESVDLPVYNAAKLAYYGLYSLQHRGQESAGSAVSNGETFEQYKAMGLVADVFKALSAGILAFFSQKCICEH